MVDRMASKTRQEYTRIYGFINLMTVEVEVSYRRAYYCSLACLSQG